MPDRDDPNILNAIEVIAALPAFICVCFKGDIVALNKRAQKALGGVPMQQLIGKPFVSFLSQDYQAFGAEFLNFVREEQNGLQVKLAAGLSDVTDLELSCVMTEKLPPDMYVLYGNDITDKVRNSKDLQQGEARYRTILSGTTGMACEIKDGAIVDINHAGQALLRVMDWRVYLNKPFSTLFYNEYEDLVAEELQALCDEKTPLPVRMLRSDGTVCDVEMTVSSLDGKMRTHLLAQMHDISIQNSALRDLRRVNDELKQQLLRVQEQQEMLQAANAKLAQVSKLEAIGTFAFGIAHEMNTPIQTLTSNLDFLQSSVAELGELIEHYSKVSVDEALDTKAANALRQLHKKTKERQIDYILDDAPKAIQDSKSGVSHISLVVKAMRDFTNRHETDASHIDVNELITEEVARMQRICGAGIALEYRLAEEKTYLFGERSEIGKAFQNIVDNAIHAIRDANKTDGRVVITCSRIKGKAVIEVADNGIGMDAKTLKKAMDPFFTTREVGRGIGQGLTIANHILSDRNGGEIEVTSEKDVGTVVKITLPVAEPEAAVPGESTSWADT